MDVEKVRDYCLSKKAVSEEFPFDEVTLVFKVMGKIFALVGLDNDLSVNLKCEPGKAVELRERYPAVQPGYHMNKKHWITVNIDGSMKDVLIRQLIDHSYEMVAAGLSHKLKSRLNKNDSE